MWLVPDTNCLLHYTYFTDAPWRELAGGQPVTVLLTYTVIRELDAKKLERSDSSVQGRARQLVSRVKSLLPGAALQPGVTFDIDVSSTRPDWSVEGLDPQLADDRLMADLLRIARERGLEQVRLVTGDFGLLLRARALGLGAISVPDEWILPHDDARDRELAKLRSELARAKEALPKIELEFSDGGGPVLQLDKPLWVPRDVAKEVEEERFRRDSAAHLTTMDPGDPTPDRSMRLDQYLEAYARYVEDLNEYNRIRANQLLLDLRLANRGELAADDLDIYLEFPDYCTLVHAGSERKPTKPTLAVQQPAPLPLILSGLDGLISARGARRPAGDDFGATYWSQPAGQPAPAPRTGPLLHGNQARYWLNCLKQGLSTRLTGLVVRLPAPRSFDIAWTAISRSAPGKTHGRLHVVSG